MASNSVEVDSDATISDLSSSGVLVDEIPPPVLDAQEEEVAMEQRNKETYIHKDYRHQFRSKGEVELFVESEGIENGIFKGRKLQKKKIAGMDAQDAGTSKSAGRRASANHARPKCSLGLSRPMDDEEMAPGFP
ncbi:unnamed protein product [Miscanthus lutarioriparius]|uniref:Uncharacterized protein n=1 Tax=Miscanthus lutarioriparius TaxID=422564 RepID=A0A811R895_9POAL|nr:unnamed protein product [Miscanthus lutarioriparius]